MRYIPPYLGHEVIGGTVKFQHSIDGINGIASVGLSKHQATRFFANLESLTGADAQPPTKRLGNGYLTFCRYDCFHT